MKEETLAMLALGGLIAYGLSKSTFSFTPFFDFDPSLSLFPPSPQGGFGSGSSGGQTSKPVNPLMYINGFPLPNPDFFSSLSSGGGGFR